MTAPAYVCAECRAPNHGTRCASCGCEQFTWVGPAAHPCKEARGEVLAAPAPEQGEAATDLDRRVAALLTKADAAGGLAMELAGVVRIMQQEQRDAEAAWERATARAEQAERRAERAERERDGVGSAAAAPPSAPPAQEQGRDLGDLPAVAQRVCDEIAKLPPMQGWFGPLAYEAARLRARLSALTAPSAPPEGHSGGAGALTLEGLLDATLDEAAITRPQERAPVVREMLRRLTPAAREALILELAAGLPAPADGYAHEVGGAAFALLRWPLPGGGAVELRQPLTEAERARLAEYPPLEGRRCAPLREVRP